LSGCQRLLQRCNLLLKLLLLIRSSQRSIARFCKFALKL
jgi:hypothetical protein